MSQERKWPIGYPGRMSSLATLNGRITLEELGLAYEPQLDTDVPKVVAWHTRCSEKPASVLGAKGCGFN